MKAVNFSFTESGQFKEKSVPNQDIFNGWITSVGT